MIPNEEQCMSIHERENTPENVIGHCKAVKDYAKTLAEKAGMKLKLNQPAIIAAALLHDIGRSKTHGIEHGVIGAKIVRSYGVDEDVCRIIERHVGAGLDDSEAARFGLPAGKIYVPITIEEKIVCYADKLVYPGGIAKTEEAIDSFRKEIGEGPALERLKKLLLEVSSLCS